MTTARHATTMRAATLDRFGGVEVLGLQTLSVPEVGPDDVLIRVETAGVGSWDAQEREGGYDGAFGMRSTFPYVLGWDAAGTVAALGERVQRFSVGDRVYAATMPLPRGGTYAEYVVVAADNVAPVPTGMTTDEAGVMGWDALTALSGLDRLDLEPGRTLMVFGASGGIGHIAVQLARRMELRVLSVASGADGVALAGRLGAELAVDGRRDDVVASARGFAPDGLDAALVTAGGTTAERALTTLRAGGRAVCPRGVTPEPAVPPGVRLDLFDGDVSPATTARLDRLVESGSFESGPFKVHVARVFGLDEVVEAHRMLATHVVGKLALRLV